MLPYGREGKGGIQKFWSLPGFTYQGGGLEWSMLQLTKLWVSDPPQGGMLQIKLPPPPFGSRQNGYVSETCFSGFYLANNFLQTVSIGNEFHLIASEKS